MSNNTKKETAERKVKTPDSHWSPWFLGTIFFALVVYVGITCINHSEAKDYREKIISNQKESLSLAKQKIRAIYKLDSVIAISQTWADTTKSDSLRSNRDSLLYINYIISHREELKRSSDALKQELDATAKETKSMIDIHLQYIDQQYSTLSLWAGIITIVFLIFSFYAVFKQEDAINKAYAIIDDLNNKLLGLDESVKSKMRKIEEDSKFLIKDIDEKVAREIEILSHKSTGLIKEIKDKAVSETKKIIQEADKQRKISQLASEADAYRKEEKYELALQKVDEAINMDSENSYLYYMKAYIAHELANYELAIECYKKAAEINPDYYGLFNNLGTVLADMAKINNDEKLFAESSEKFQKAAEFNPKDENIFNNWGNTLSEWGKVNNDEKLFSESLEKYKKAAEINPKNDNIFLNWGNVLYLLAKINNNSKLFSESCKKYQNSAEINPKNDIIFYNWGIALSYWAKRNKNEKLFLESIEKFKKAAEINPNNKSILINWGITLLSLAKLKNDLNSYKQNIESILQKAEAIKEGSASYILACLYSLVNQKSQALKWLEINLKLNPNLVKEKILSDPDLNNIKSDPQFKELLDKYF